MTKRLALLLVPLLLMLAAGCKSGQGASRFQNEKVENNAGQDVAESESPPQIIYQKTSYLHRGVFYEGEEDKLILVGKIETFVPGALDPKTTDDLVGNYADLVGKKVYVIAEYEGDFLFVETSDGKIDIFHARPNGPRWEEND